MEIKDLDTVYYIVNENWKKVYVEYVNEALLTQKGCSERNKKLKEDFISNRLSGYVVEEDGRILGMLAFGNTEDIDKEGVFEIWYIYVAQDVQGKGVGSSLLSFGEQQARNAGHNEIVIWAFKENKLALAFYEKHGYRVEKEAYLGEAYLAYGVRLHKEI
ncbi:MAG: GNAT family N-acetyltransferase [Cellulosilyticaceae bacterium]